VLDSAGDVLCGDFREEGESKHGRDAAQRGVQEPAPDIFRQQWGMRDVRRARHSLAGVYGGSLREDERQLSAFPTAAGEGDVFLDGEDGRHPAHSWHDAEAGVVALVELHQGDRLLQVPRRGILASCIGHDEVGAWALVVRVAVHAACRSVHEAELEAERACQADFCGLGELQARFQGHVPLPAVRLVAIQGVLRVAVVEVALCGGHVRRVSGPDVEHCSTAKKQRVQLVHDAPYGRAPERGRRGFARHLIPVRAHARVERRDELRGRRLAHLRVPQQLRPLRVVFEAEILCELDEREVLSQQLPRLVRRRARSALGILVQRRP